MFIVKLSRLLYFSVVFTVSDAPENPNFKIAVHFILLSQQTLMLLVQSGFFTCDNLHAMFII